MPINAASRSIHLPAEMAETHTVLFAVFTNLVGTDTAPLHQHLQEHLAFIKSLREKGILPVSGPFFTPDGQNTGDGIYALAVDSLEEAERIAAEDPMHRLGIRVPNIRPWVRD